MTADPNLVDSARTVARISYGEAAELARLGAKVLHSKMIEPVIEQEIPIRILNSRAPERGGTIIGSDTNLTNGAVKAIAYKTNLTGIDITSTPALVANGFLSAIKDICHRHRVGMQIVGSLAAGISFACEESGSLASLIEDLERIGSVETKPHRAMVSCVGEGLQREDSAENLRRTLSDIDPTLRWHSTSSLSLISMIDRNLVGSVVREIHQSLFTSELPT
jgi:aspartate kinase